MDRRLGIPHIEMTPDGLRRVNFNNRHWQPTPPTPQHKLPELTHKLWPGLRDLPNVRRSDLEQLLEQIQNAIDRTWVFPLWWGRCQAWVNEFERHLPPAIGLNPCVKEANMGWEPAPSIGGGHAYYYFILKDGTTIIIDNGYKTGNDHFDILFAPLGKRAMPAK